MRRTMINHAIPEPGQPRPLGLSGARRRGCPRGAASFGVETRIDRGTATVVLSGELDLTIVPVLSELLAPILAAKPRRLVFDMAWVTFIDCASARLITQAGGYLAGSRGPVVVHPVPAVRRIFEVTGFAGRCEMTR